LKARGQALTERQRGWLGEEVWQEVKSLLGGGKPGAYQGFDLLGGDLLFGLSFPPLFGFIAWAIKRDSPGPVFYRGRIAGFEG
jgi:lipopolysaccharide/colanic/teichoic acid biosynthesis glycosyltransferase